MKERKREGVGEGEREREREREMYVIGTSFPTQEVVLSPEHDEFYREVSPLFNDH